MTSAQIIITVTIALYLGAMVFVGIYFGKKGSGASSDVLWQKYKNIYTVIHLLLRTE